MIPGSEANFTWEDLERVKGNIVLSPDSSWVPSIIGQNIINTIKYVLNPKNAKGGIPLCKGINVHDLYHAHIVMPEGKIPKDIIDERKKFEPDYDKSIEKAYPDLGGKPSAAERVAIRQADEEIRGKFEKFLQLVVSFLPKASMIYHTYEDEKPPGLADDDPRRQIMMPFSGKIPVIGVKFWEYSTVIQISFLVSGNGQLFIRGADDRSLRGLELYEHRAKQQK